MLKTNVECLCNTNSAKFQKIACKLTGEYYVNGFIKKAQRAET